MPADSAGEEQGIVRKTVSMDAATFTAGLEQAKARGFKNSFSAYIAWLIERDQAGGVTPTISLAEEPPGSPASHQRPKILHLRAAEDEPKH